MKKLFFFFVLNVSFSFFGQGLSKKFTYLSKIDKTIQFELRYLGNNNFIGTPIDGYYKNRVIVTKKTAYALKKVQQILLKK